MGSKDKPIQDTPEDESPFNLGIQSTLINPELNAWPSK